MQGFKATNLIYNSFIRVENCERFRFYCNLRAFVFQCLYSHIQALCNSLGARRSPSPKFEDAHMSVVKCIDLWHDVTQIALSYGWHLHVIKSP